MFKVPSAKPGFTIVELLVVVIIIAVLAVISVAAYANAQQRASTSRRNAEMAQLIKAIHSARMATGKTLLEITGYNYSSGRCTMVSYNPDGLEPRELPSSHACWTQYRHNLNMVSEASGVNLSSLHSGDARGNPYTWDENEGENGNYCLIDSPIRYFTGNGITYTDGHRIPKSHPTC